MQGTAPKHDLTWHRLADRPVLIVDNDAVTSATLAAELGEHGFVASVARTAQETEATLLTRGARYDAVILDVSLPDDDGRDLCRRLRSGGINAPIIMLTDLDREADVIRGLDSGANDYIAKPFRAAELLARLRAQLRIFDSSEDAVFTVGPYIFRPAARLLHDPRRGHRIPLTNKEAALLRFLYRANGRPVARQVLLKEVWGYSAHIVTHTLETHI